MQLRDGDLLLRPFRDDDVPAITAACQDEEMHRFIPHLPWPYREEHAREYVELTQAWASEGNRLALAIADADDDLLGAIDVRLSDEGTIGYWVAPWARGRGVATRALKLLCRYAAEEAGVTRLLLTTHPGNVASQRVAEKAGFRRTGTLDREAAHPRFRDGTDWSLLFELDYAARSRA